MIKTADWVIDLGPEGGDKGGYLLAAGTPEDVAAVPESSTGRYLRPVLGMRPLAAAGGAQPTRRPRRRQPVAVAS